MRRSEVHTVVAKSLLERLSCPLTLARIAEAHRSYLQAESARNGSGGSGEALQQQIEEKRAALTRLVRESALAEGEEIRAARYQVQKELQEEIRTLARQLEPAPADGAAELPALIEEMIPIAAGNVTKRLGHRSSCHGGIVTPACSHVVTTRRIQRSRRWRSRTISRICWSNSSCRRTCSLQRL